MEIMLKIRVDAEGATPEQVRNLPEEIRRAVETCLVEWLPNEALVELVNKEA